MNEKPTSQQVPELEELPETGLTDQSHQPGAAPNQGRRTPLTNDQVRAIRQSLWD